MEESSAAFPCQTFAIKLLPASVILQPVG